MFARVHSVNLSVNIKCLLRKMSLHSTSLLKPLMHFIH